MDMLIALAVGAALGAGGLWWLLRRRRAASEGRGRNVSVAAAVERVATAGRLVGLEVCAREIATSTRGLSFLPPLLLSQARLAMIFQFEKQYAVDLTTLGPEDAQPLEGGGFRLTLPPVEGSLRLVDVTPYDIAAGKALGLIDVIPMDAKAQQALMREAQEQAASLFEKNEARYEALARASVEKQARALLAMLGVRVEIAWRDEARSADCAPEAAAPQLQAVA